MTTTPTGTHRAPVGAVLSVTGGALLCDLDDLYRLLSALTGRDLMTHQLPPAADAVRDHLLAEHPWARGLNAPSELIRDEPTARAYLAGVTDALGYTHVDVTAPAPGTAGLDLDSWALERLAGNR